jgi:ribonuclease P protein subunit RPR2
MKGSKSIAAQRIELLYHISRMTVKKEPCIAKRYIDLLFRIVQRTKINIPQHIKQSICKKCKTPLIPGYNSHTRIRTTREPHIATTCHNCKTIYRLPLGENVK